MELTKDYHDACDENNENFTVHHPTLLAPFPSNLIPGNQRNKITKGIVYTEITDNSMEQYKQPPNMMMQGGRGTRSSPRNRPQRRTTRHVEAVNNKNYYYGR